MAKTASAKPAISAKKNPTVYERRSITSLSGERPIFKLKNEPCEKLSRYAVANVVTDEIAEKECLKIPLVFE